MKASPAVITPPFTKNLTISCTVNVSSTADVTDDVTDDITQDVNRDTERQSDKGTTDSEVGYVSSIIIKKMTESGEEPIASINDREPASVLIDREDVHVTGSLEKNDNALR